mgnify:CR=1 FL=1
MPITDILEYNAEHYGDDVCLVDINPKIQEKRKVLWKDYNYDILKENDKLEIYEIQEIARKLD